MAEKTKVPPSKVPLAECCGTCRFWLADEGGDKGECRRYPPVLAALPAQFPIKVTTVPAHWCGEFQRKSERTSTTPERRSE